MRQLLYASIAAASILWFVPGVTGLMLWFSVAVTFFLPRWWVDVALTIHLYEAILATLAVIVWHFYHVIFDPMSTR